MAKKIARIARVIFNRSGATYHRVDPALTEGTDPPQQLRQYLSIHCTERVAEAGIGSSVGSRGDSYDNALAERINGLYKSEVVHRRGPWRNRDAVEYAMPGWVDWFNNRRLLEPIGNIPPAELEAAYYRQHEESAIVA